MRPPRRRGRYYRRLQDYRRLQGEAPLPPLPPGIGLASARPEHGRFDSRPDEIADVDVLDMADKIAPSRDSPVDPGSVLDG
jgi:hypothetical protein